VTIRSIFLLQHKPIPPGSHNTINEISQWIYISQSNHIDDGEKMQILVTYSFIERTNYVIGNEINCALALFACDLWMNAPIVVKLSLKFFSKRKQNKIFFTRLSDVDLPYLMLRLPRDFMNNFTSFFSSIIFKLCR